MKQTISATIDTKLAKWIEKELADTMRFRNRSHLVEHALVRLKETLGDKKGGQR